MPDEDLRALERAARTWPDDLSAGWAYARALGRAGDPLEHDVLVGLARRGDAEAQAAVEAWNPWPTDDGAGRGRRWRGPAVRRLGAERRLGLGRDAYLAAVGRRHLFTVVEHDEALVARGLDDLAVRWRRGPCVPTRVALAGDLVVAVDDRRLLAWDATSGRDVAEARAPGPIVSVLPVQGARAIVVAGGQARCVDLRAEAFGAVSFSHPLGPDSVVAAGGPWVLVTDRRPTILSAESGEPAWTLPEGGVLRLLAADAAGALCDDRALVALDPGARATRWRFEHPGRVDPHRLALDETTVVARFAGQGQTPPELVALRRDTGAVRWRRPLDPRMTMALLPGALYLAVARRVGHKVLEPRVAVLDPLDGAVLEERTLPRTSLITEPYVAPLPGGLLVVNGGDLYVFEDRAGST